MFQFMLCIGEVVHCTVFNLYYFGGCSLVIIKITVFENVLLFSVVDCYKCLEVLLPHTFFCTEGGGIVWFFGNVGICLSNYMA
jgi:hypothetical protein